MGRILSALPPAPLSMIWIYIAIMRGRQGKRDKVAIRLFGHYPG